MCRLNCNILLAGAPKVTTDKLQRVLNAAARVLTGTHKGLTENAGPKNGGPNRRA